MEAKESLSSFADSIQKKSCSEFGRILGKSALVAPSEEQFDLLLQRLKQQLGEGRGEVILEVTKLVVLLIFKWCCFLRNQQLKYSSEK